MIIATYKADADEYVLEKEIQGDRVCIMLFQLCHQEKEFLDQVVFKHTGEEYESPFLSWYNLFFCSNNYKAAPDYNYMNGAVQAGKKTAATIYYPFDSDEGRKIRSSLPSDCGCLPYGDKIMYVFHKGKLRDFFDYQKVQEIYQSRGGYMIDWDIIKEYFDYPMETFGDERLCGFSLQSGGTKEQHIINGLILGYPIESTVDFLYLER